MRPVWQKPASGRLHDWSGKIHGADALWWPEAASVPGAEASFPKMGLPRSLETESYALCEWAMTLDVLASEEDERLPRNFPLSTIDYQATLINLAPAAHIKYKDQSELRISQN